VHCPARQTRLPLQSVSFEQPCDTDVFVEGALLQPIRTKAMASPTPAFPIVGWRVRGRPATTILDDRPGLAAMTIALVAILFQLRAYTGVDLLALGGQTDLGS